MTNKPQKYRPKLSQRGLYFGLVVAGIGVFSVTLRLLASVNVGDSALFYVAVPVLISLALIVFTNEIEPAKRWPAKYWNAFRGSMIVFFGGAVVLHEGFICALMFLPIYWLGFLLAMLIHAGAHAYKNEGRLWSLAPAALVAILSLEGTAEELSLSRDHAVSRAITLPMTVAEIKQNLQRPIVFDDDKPLFLSLFPSPYLVEAESLKVGDVHSIHYRYHRWFVTNTHEGMAQLKIAEVSDSRIRTEFVSDNSYLSNYLIWQGTQIDMQPLAAGGTRVQLTIHYHRKLDPSWYFAPLQALAMEQAADYLLENIIGG